MRTGSTPSEFAEFAGRDLILPTGMRAELARPLGPVLRGRSFGDAIGTAKPLVAVGDVVTAELVRAEHMPDVAIVDFRTRRADNPEAKGLFAGAQYRVITLSNPAGRIVAAAWDAIREAFKAGGRVRVEVRGEEDLLALVAIALAPDGSVVVYGQPDEGAVVVRVDAAARGRVKSVLRRMQGSDGD